SPWPRRLIYCLPMRTLVDQTAGEVTKWMNKLRDQVDNLGSSAQDEMQWLAQRSPIVLMGGEELDGARREWDLHPEKPIVLIGSASFWMSATLQKDWLKTVDFADPSSLALVKLDEDDLQNRDVRERREARKPVQATTARMEDSTGLAAEILNAHQRAGGRTLA